MHSTKWAFEYVRFTVVGSGVSAEARLAALRHAVEALANEKLKSPSGSSQMEPDCAEDLAESILPPMALATFRSNGERDAWLPPSGLVEPGWDERSMLAAVLAGETRLYGIVVDDAGTAELRFEALAWPYGGISSLLRLVEAFGFDIVSYNDGSMPEVSRAQHVSWQRR